MTRTFGIFIWVVAVMTALSQPVYAGPCDNASSAYEAATCFDRQYGLADKHLNVVYKRHRADLDDTGKELLRNAQRAWIKYRDAECLRVADSSRGGTDAAIQGLICQTVLTERRIKDLGGALVAQTQGRNETDDLYWKSGRPIFETFDCQNSLEARLALVPDFGDMRAQPTLTARLIIGDHKLNFPIVGKPPTGATPHTFCGADISMTVINSASACPSIRLHDGMCDPVSISWDKQKKAFHWYR